jgi:hypothetical protein
MFILGIRNKKLFTGTDTIDLNAALTAELAYVSSLLG